MRVLTICSILVTFVAASTSRAQGPPHEQCGQFVNTAGETDNSVTACMSELLSVQEDMIDAVEGAVVEMQALNLSALGTGEFALQRQVMDDDLMEKIQFLRDEHRRASEANEAVDNDDYDVMFAKADQEREGRCKLSDMEYFESLAGDPPPGLRDPGAKFGDGKCNVFKATVDLPGAANDGEIVHVNERRENMCAEACADRMNAGGNGRLRKEERKERVVGRLTDGIATARRATDTIAVATANLARLRVRLQEIESGRVAGSDVCVSGFDVPALLEIIATGVSIANSVVSFTTAALETAKDNVKPAANQTVAGFNAGSSVIPFALVAGISKMAGEVLGGVEKGLAIAAQIISATRDDTIEECLRSVRDDAVEVKGEFAGPDGAIFKLQEAVALLQGDAAQSNVELAAVRAELAVMKELVEGNRELLLTPFGRRGGPKQ